MSDHKRTYTKGSLNREISKLADNINMRIRRPKKVERKMFIWKVTVQFSYKLKRVTDFIVALLGLIFLFPFLVVIGAIIKLTSPGPIIFAQKRVGRFGRIFRMFKFRSMYDGSDSLPTPVVSPDSDARRKEKTKDDPRITPFGRFIRKTSIDELPQLINVLLGDMSLVGPRPPTPDEVMKYTLDDRKRLNVIPGLTGLWQISGRSDIPADKQLELDKKYIASQSIWFDFCIILKTIPAIITGRGAY